MTVSNDEAIAVEGLRCSEVVLLGIHKVSSVQATWALARVLLSDSPHLDYSLVDSHRDGERSVDIKIVIVGR